MELIEMCTGAQDGAVRKEGPSLDTFVVEIKGHWGNATTSYLAVAKACAEANDKLSAPEKAKLIEQLPFDRTFFSKLAKIGITARLHEAQFSALLPAHFSTAYEIAKLSDEEFHTAIDEKIIHAGVTRAKLLAWKKSHAQVASEASIRAEDISTSSHPQSGEIADDFALAELMTAWDRATENARRRFWEAKGSDVANLMATPLAARTDI